MSEEDKQIMIEYVKNCLIQKRSIQQCVEEDKRN